MSIDERKAGGASVDPDDFNAVVDAVSALQGGLVRVPIAFDTPNLVTTSLPIIAVDQEGSLTVAGDYRADFDRLFASGGGSLVVNGSTGNDGFYTVASPATLDGLNTVVELTAPLSDDTADGDINVLSGGISVYTPSDGDVLLLSAVRVTTAWNGSSDPSLRIFQANADPTLDDLQFPLKLADPPPAGSTTPDVWMPFQADDILAWDAGDSFVMKAAAGAIYAVVSDSNDLSDPGSTQGEGELILLILPAAA